MTRRSFLRLLGLSSVTAVLGKRALGSTKAPETAVQLPTAPGFVTSGYCQVVDQGMDVEPCFKPGVMEMGIRTRRMKLQSLDVAVGRGEHLIFYSTAEFDEAVRRIPDEELKRALGAFYG